MALQFIPPGTDLRPILPVLAKVFDQALAGGGAKGINFQVGALPRCPLAPCCCRCGRQMCLSNTLLARMCNLALIVVQLEFQLNFCYCRSPGACC